MKLLSYWTRWREAAQLVHTVSSSIQSTPLPLPPPKPEVHRSPPAALRRQIYSSSYSFSSKAASAGKLPRVYCHPYVVESLSSLKF